MNTPEPNPNHADVNRANMTSNPPPEKKCCEKCENPSCIGAQTISRVDCFDADCPCHSTPDTEMEGVREVSDKIWNAGTRLTHNKLDEILKSLIKSEKEKSFAEGAAATVYRGIETDLGKVRTELLDGLAREVGLLKDEYLKKVLSSITGQEIEGVTALDTVLALIESAKKNIK